MKFSLTLFFFVLGATSLFAQNTPAASAPTQSIVLSEESDSPVILYDNKEITQGELAAMDASAIGDIKILSGEEAKTRFGKYETNGAIVISSTPPADVVNTATRTIESSSVAYSEKEGVGKTEGATTSFSFDLEAYVIVDGKPSTMDVLQTMKPTQIESINVLKEAEAIEKYGELGKNGAVEVTSKQ